MPNFYQCFRIIQIYGYPEDSHLQKCVLNNILLEFTLNYTNTADEDALLYCRKLQ